MRKTFGILTALVLTLISPQWAKADSCNGLSANLITICGFETGDFTGWSGTAPIDRLYNYVSSGSADENTYDAFLGSLNPETVSQKFATTAGTQYLIQFALRNDASSSIV